MKTHRPDFEHLRDVLRDICRDEPVYYFPNPGNWGDGLIRAGTLRFFETHGFQVEGVFPHPELGGPVIDFHRYTPSIRRAWPLLPRSSMNMW